MECDTRLIRPNINMHMRAVATAVSSAMLNLRLSPFGLAAKNANAVNMSQTTNNSGYIVLNIKVPLVI